MPDKTFHTYRKGKNLNEFTTYKWNPFNLVNKHYTRQTDQVKDLLDETDVARRIYQSRPDLVLNIGNEYITRNMMGDLAKFYTNTALNAPKRHFLTRFVRDLKEDALNEIDFCHYTVPLNTSNSNGFVFPGDFVG